MLAYRLCVVRSNSNPMDHWLTKQLAEDLIAAARTGALMQPPRHATGLPDTGPLQSVELQACDCCDNLLLFIDGRQVDSEVFTPEDLILNVLFAESERIGSEAGDCGVTP